MRQLDHARVCMQLCKHGWTRGSGAHMASAWSELGPFTSSRALLRGCLVSIESKLQNTNYFEVMKCNAKIFRIMFSSIHNTEFIVIVKLLEAYFRFFGILRPKSKMKNNYIFTKNFAWFLVPLWPCLVPKNFAKLFRFPFTLNLATHA